MAIATLKQCTGYEVQPENALDDNIAARALALREGRKMPPLAKHNTGDAALEEHRRLARNATFEAFEGQSIVRDLVEQTVDEHPEQFEGWTADDFCELATRVVWQSPAPVQPATKEFHSRPNAAPIPKAEVCNFEPLTKWDRLQIDEAVENAVWGGWPAGDNRWTLTPAEWRKQKRRGLVQQKQRKAK